MLSLPQNTQNCRFGLQSLIVSTANNYTSRLCLLWANIQLGFVQLNSFPWLFPWNLEGTNFKAKPWKRGWAVSCWLFTHGKLDVVVWLLNIGQARHLDAGTWLEDYLWRHIKLRGALTFAGSWENIKCWKCIFSCFDRGVYRAGAWVRAAEWTCGTCSSQYLVFARFLRFASFNCLSSPKSLRRQPYLPPFMLSVGLWSSWECTTFTCGLPDEAHFGKSGK